MDGITWNRIGKGLAEFSGLASFKRKSNSYHRSQFNLPGSGALSRFSSTWSTVFKTMSKTEKEFLRQKTSLEVNKILAESIACFLYQ